MTELVHELPRLAPRAPDSHKGDFGRILIVGGSRGMAGALGLAGLAALRGGAGLVRLAAPASCLDVVASFEPSYMTAPLDEDDHGRIALSAERQIRELAAAADVVAIGPGLGRSEELASLSGRLFADLPRPMVIDADALHALALQPELLRPSARRSSDAPRVLTPHVGEFLRLLGTGRESLPESDRRGAAEALARQIGRVVIVLKGRGAVVTDGARSAINATGNPGMATGGSGDVLTGLVAALLGQGLPPWEAARLAVHWHGRAGDLAAAELGQPSLIASDLVHYLPAAARDAP